MSWMRGDDFGILVSNVAEQIIIAMYQHMSLPHIPAIPQSQPACIS